MKTLNRLEIQTVSGRELTALQVGCMFVGGTAGSRLAYIASEAIVDKYKHFGVNRNFVHAVAWMSTLVFQPIGTYLGYKIAQFFEKGPQSE